MLQQAPKHTFQQLLIKSRKSTRQRINPLPLREADTLTPESRKQAPAIERPIAYPSSVDACLHAFRFPFKYTPSLYTQQNSPFRLFVSICFEPKPKPQLKPVNCQSSLRPLFCQSSGGFQLINSLLPTRFARPEKWPSPRKKTYTPKTEGSKKSRVPKIKFKFRFFGPFDAILR